MDKRIVANRERAIKDIAAFDAKWEAAVRQLREKDYGVKAISKRTGLSKKPIRRILKILGYGPIKAGMSKANHEAMERRYGKPCNSGGEGKKWHADGIIMADYANERRMAARTEKQWATLANWLIQYRRDKEKITKRQAEYHARPEIAERRKRYHKKWRDANKQYLRKWSREYMKDWYKRPGSKEKVQAAQRKHRKKPEVRCVMRLRKRLRLVIKNRSERARINDLIGCTPQQLRDWIQSKFKRGMHWNNMGLWHIDHIIPCASFNLFDKRQQRLCFHFTNLQPLWASDNLAKSDKMPNNPQLALI